jgi:Tol biopolymer transport system component
LALSPDATHAVVRRADRDANNDLWLVDLLRGGSERLTSNPAVEANGVWSPDGRRIVFTSSRDGIYNLYQKNLSGDGKEELLLKSDENKVPYDWSRDGRFLLYVSVSSKTGYDLWILPMTGERKPLPLVGTQFREDQAQFSPDGQWVAYTSDASDTSEVYVRPLTPSEGNREERLISNGGGSQPRWRGDGRELYYFAGRKLMAVDTTTSPAFKVGVPRPLFETTVSIGNTMGVHNWDVTRDGKRFLITVASENNSAPINVVLNWQTALRK